MVNAAVRGKEVNEHHVPLKGGEKGGQKMMSNAVLSRGVVLEDANVDQTFEVGAVVKGKVVVKPSSRGTRQRQLVRLPAAIGCSPQK